MIEFTADEINAVRQIAIDEDVTRKWGAVCVLKAASCVRKLEAIRSRQQPLTAEYCERVGMVLLHDGTWAIAERYENRRVRFGPHDDNRWLTLENHDGECDDWRLSDDWRFAVEKRNPTVSDLHTWAEIAGIELREVSR